MMQDMVAKGKEDRRENPKEMRENHRNRRARTVSRFYVLFCFVGFGGPVVDLVACRLVVRVVASHYCDNAPPSHQNHHQDFQKQKRKSRQENEQTLFRSRPGTHIFFFRHDDQNAMMKQHKLVTI